MRAFIALELPDNLKKQLFSLTKLLRSGGDTVRWVRPENMHLTLRFLGEINAEQAEWIGSSLRASCEARSPIHLGVGGLGAFPKRRNPKVIWVGIRPHAELTAMYEELEAVVREVGIEPEYRLFKPHLTLGRVKFLEKGSRLPRRLGEVDLETVFVTVERITMFRSELKPEGPVYSPLETCRFSG